MDGFALEGVQKNAFLIFKSLTLRQIKALKHRVSVLFLFLFGVSGLKKFWVMFLTAILTALVNLRIYIEILKIITQRKDEYDIINARN